MRKSRFIDSQIMAVLKKADAGAKVLGPQIPTAKGLGVMS